MKTYCKGLRITEGIVREAYLEWAQSPAGKRNLFRVPREYGNAEALISEIASEIENRSLSFKPIVRSERWDDNARKHRVIGVSSVKQQVCDYIVIGCIEPLLNAKVGFYQVAGVKGKGAPLVKKALSRWAKECEGWYFVDCDIRKCYPSTSVDLVYRIYQRYVKSDDVMYVVRTILDTYDGGMEIGSYFSLRTMAFILSFAYHKVESMHKVRRRKRKRLVEHQIWHVDDFILISQDKRDLKVAVRELSGYMERELGLHLKPWKISRIGEDEPMTMSLFVVRPSHVELRPRTFIKGRRAIRRFDRLGGIKRARRTASYVGMFSQADCFTFMSRERAHGIQSRASSLISVHERRKVGRDD